LHDKQPGLSSTPSLQLPFAFYRPEMNEKRNQYQITQLSLERVQKIMISQFSESSKQASKQPAMIKDRQVLTPANIQILLFWKAQSRCVCLFWKIN